MERWNPGQAVSVAEERLLRRLGRTRKLFAFLRTYRHELFDEAFQTELAAVYRETGAGRAPVPPALLAMAVLLQGYLGASDAEAVELTVVDLRWQLVLGCLGAQTPAFAQGTLQGFRERLIRTGLDVRLLERTVELAQRTGAFEPKALRQRLRIAIDSAPLEGAGRVEDTVESDRACGAQGRRVRRHPARGEPGRGLPAGRDSAPAGAERQAGPRCGVE